MDSESLQNPRKVGRPQKFTEPRRPITVTLPESTLQFLAAVNPDRARAIVKVTKEALQAAKADSFGVEVAEIAPGVGIILVGPSLLLRRIPLLRLVEVAPNRYLLSLQLGTPIDSLELALVDLLDSVSPSDIRERQMIEELRKLIRNLRLDGAVTKAEMLFVDTKALRKL